MRRRSDRIQALARVVVLLLVLVGCASAAAVGRVTYERQAAVERADARVGYRVTGHVVSEPSAAVAPDGHPVRGAARVAWQDRAGRRHVQAFVVGTDARTVPLWIGADGRASLTPPRPSGVVIAAATSGIGWLFATTAGLAVAYLAAVLALDRRRYAEWEREWASVEPGWRRQTL